jgi:hypothetical protein
MGKNNSNPCDCDVCSQGSESSSESCSSKNSSSKSFFAGDMEPKKTNNMSDMTKQFKKDFDKENCNSNSNSDCESDQECGNESGCESDSQCDTQCNHMCKPKCKKMCKHKCKWKPIPKPKVCKPEFKPISMPKMPTCKPHFEPIKIPKIHCKKPEPPKKPESCPSLPPMSCCGEFPPMKKHKFKKPIFPCDDSVPCVKPKKPCACEPIPEDWAFPPFPKMCDDCNFDANNIKSKFYKEIDFCDFPKFPNCDTPDFDCEMNNSKFQSSIKSFQKA